MSATPKVRTVTLTGKPPVRVREDLWPVIASARRHDGQVECQANHLWHLTVRQHAAVPVVGSEYEPHEDERVLVYASNTAGNGGVYQGWEEARAGEMVERGADVAAAIRRVGERARCSEAMIDECIADLPAVDLDEPSEPVTIKMPLNGARRLLNLIDEIAIGGGSVIDPRYAEQLRAVADELRAVVEARS